MLGENFLIPEIPIHIFLCFFLKIAQIYSFVSHANLASKFSTIWIKFIVHKLQNYWKPWISHKKGGIAVSMLLFSK